MKPWKIVTIFRFPFDNDDDDGQTELRMSRGREETFGTFWDLEESRQKIWKWSYDKQCWITLLHHRPGDLGL